MNQQYQKATYKTNTFLNCGNLITTPQIVTSEEPATAASYCTIVIFLKFWEHW